MPRKLNSVEINHTFRRFPRLEVIEAWAEKTPEHFRFSFKMHQSVTHMARLKNVGRSVSDFLDALIPLKKRLGVVLFQLPPFFKLNHERLDSFLGELPAGFRYAWFSLRDGISSRVLERACGRRKINSCGGRALWLRA